MNDDSIKKILQDGLDNPNTIAIKSLSIIYLDKSSKPYTELLDGIQIECEIEGEQRLTAYSIIKLTMSQLIEAVRRSHELGLHNKNKEFREKIRYEHERKKNNLKNLEKIKYFSTGSEV